VVSTLINDILNKLRKLYDRILFEKQDSYYYVTIFHEGKPNYILCIYSSLNKYVYGKIIDFSISSGFNCLDILYDPRGLFIFARDPGEFIDKLVKKIELLKSGGYG